MTRDLLLTISVILLGSLVADSAILEEFVVRGPDELHTLALQEVLTARRASEDKTENVMAEGSPLMERGKAYAISRGEVPSDESLTVKVKFFHTQLSISLLNYICGYINDS